MDPWRGVDNTVSHSSTRDSKAIHISSKGGNQQGGRTMK
jgi:hypothetical protein